MDFLQQDLFFSKDLVKMDLNSIPTMKAEKPKNWYVLFILYKLLAYLNL